MNPSFLRSSLRAVGALLLSAALLAQSAPAAAHPDLDRGKELAADLDLAPALAAFQAALVSGTLTRAELITLLDERVLVLYGLRRRTELHEDMLWLSALEPDHRLDLRAPPELIAMWTSVRDQARGPLSLNLRAELDGDALKAEALPAGTVPETGLDTRVYLRDGLRSYKQYGPSLREPARAGARYGLYAETIGLGGVVVAHAYTAEEPLEVQGARSALPAAATPVERESWAKAHRGWLIGGAVLLLAAGAITTGILVKQSKDDQSNQTKLMPEVDFN
jgi:hypothetical protein